MLLIADSGSTKTDWCAVDHSGRRIDFKSQGYNPNYISQQDMQRDVAASMPAELNPDDIEEIYFYGAGVTEMQYGFVREALSQVFGSTKTIFVSMDLLGSARALLGHESGFAAILGTGTNSCLYDGERVTLNIDSLGFILGDEGSGGYMGKRLICDFIRGDMPREVQELTAREIPLSGDELIDQIYTKPFPNRFCARYSMFIGQNIDLHPYFRNLVTNSLRAFFEKIVSHYPDYRNYRLNCVGSVGYHYRELLSSVAAEYGMAMGKVLKAPMEGLVEYHLDESRPR